MKNSSAITRILDMKQSGEKIACLTAYDASFSRLLESCGIDMVLVGDSLGMVLQGEKDTLAVTLEDMIYHTRMVRQGIQQTLLAVDMPVDSYLDPQMTVDNANRLLDEGGADMVKLEGGRDILGQVKALSAADIAICGHLGLQPQSVVKYGGYKVQGRNQDDADRILEDAVALEQAGVKMIVLECIPMQLAEAITQAISIPTIGIGAGVNCDGQILVIYDVIGLSGYIPKMANNFLSSGGDINTAINDYIEAVKSGKFPTNAQSFQ
ncbi:MAG: 3-methyl-2-oxobutanoate hydroxymethyltransferase [Gammaproteobacteria bacterium]|nr:3-methyl-2-oxobutanoate hydroxymethyltransferase [Gammaproteobacteria bacterium]